MNQRKSTKNHIVNNKSRPLQIEAQQLDDYWESETETNTLRVQKLVAGTLLHSLYAGINDYQDSYASQLKRYPYSGIFIANSSQAIKNHTYFRNKFIAYLNQYVLSSDPYYQGDHALRVTHPEKATISMQDLLGEAVVLYKLALEEEVNSKKYMDAVLHKSTKACEGKRWIKRPIIIVGGPSGSGKSYAADAVVKRAEQDHYLPTRTEEGINYVISVDGGVAREISQIRKLMIKVANQKGYTGIKDLHQQSEYLEKTKQRMLNFALEESNPHGVVIPETFSTFSTLIANAAQIMLNKIANLSNCVPIFSQVIGENAEQFKKAVAFMGSRRAWKTDWTSPIDLDMNSTQGLAESKAYGASGFRWGKLGSEQAANYFQKKLAESGKGYIGLTITNELQVVEVPGQPKILAPQSIVENYKKVNQDIKNVEELKAYIKSHPSSSSILSDALLSLHVEMGRLMHYMKKLGNQKNNFVYLNLHVLIDDIHSLIEKESPMAVNDFIYRLKKNKLELKKLEASHDIKEMGMDDPADILKLIDCIVIALEKVKVEYERVEYEKLRTENHLLKTENSQLQSKLNKNFSSIKKISKNAGSEENKQFTSSLNRTKNEAENSSYVIERDKIIQKIRPTPLWKKILIGAAIGLGIGAVAVGIGAALVFSGGSAAIPLTLGAVAIGTAFGLAGTAAMAVGFATAAIGMVGGCTLLGASAAALNSARKINVSKKTEPLLEDKLSELENRIDKINNEEDIQSILVRGLINSINRLVRNKSPEEIESFIISMEEQMSHDEYVKQIGKKNLPLIKAIVTDLRILEGEYRAVHYQQLKKENQWFVRKNQNLKNRLATTSNKKMTDILSHSKTQNPPRFKQLKKMKSILSPQTIKMIFHHSRIKSRVLARGSRFSFGVHPHSDSLRLLKEATEQKGKQKVTTKL